MDEQSDSSGRASFPTSIIGIAFLSTNAYGVFALFNLVGMIGAGVLADRTNQRFLPAGIYLVRSVALIVPLFVGVHYPIPRRLPCWYPIRVR